ncbi:serine phosphatase RsbU (regulator of sigma subunit)/anti-sigma regulatory factor (Ser/Thr protein kinase) [Streptomyces sp. DSM 42143]|uniref:ATP-binding SpoIIE family protein phosphatase n=1 Tax=Streptomyces TaxID=1883 RepID=UPI002781EA5F|nr:SpoIIE family protein phosphatase [Streptomyces sp. DSM 42143]MDQ0384352.1 serine phosphatase RsbU (regulator of sigma subunit)/anti-sigma regulatory factor (Ser/Thr protein kinase) [Streptomyces sp. DSM 42143]
MDHGTERDAPFGRGAGPRAVSGDPMAGRVPLAVVVVDRDGLVSHWSRGARRLFALPKEEAIGRPAADLLPVSGVLPGTDDADDHDSHADCDGLGPDLESSLDGGLSYPAAGRARLTVPDDDRVDVLWWAYPLVGPGPERLLVLAADADALSREHAPENAGRGATATTVERIAPGFALHTDFPGADELARRLPEILPSMSVGESARIVAQVLELGYPVLEFSQNDRVPVTPDWGVPRRAERRARRERAARALAAGEPVPDDLRDEAEDLEYAAVRERLEFLNEVSGRIGTSLDLSRTIVEVSRAVVPRFTDVAGTYLREQIVAGEGFPDGVPDTTTMWHRVALEHTDEPGRWDDVVPVGEAMPFPAHTPFFQCMTSGEPVLVPRITEEMGHAIASQFEKRDIRPLITGRSMLLVPLKARTVVLGFMILLRHPERPVFNDMDRVTGAELAARAGLVLDNARMYTYQENVAETLQDSMLPHIPARMAGCDISTRYLPGTLLGRVGGDWFDAVKLPGARTALVVGDVMGHGLNSAAMMGQLRTAVQTMAGLDLPPAQLLRNLDDLAQRLGDTYLATCLYAVYDPIAGELNLANAGHIPPVLVRAADGGSELIDLPTGAPIGVGGVPFEAVRVPVAPGDRLVMCTDGLVEVRGEDIGIGLATLCESAAHPAASMDDACDTIIRALGTRGGRKDDVALLMARLGGIDTDSVAEWRLARDPAEVGRARAAVREQLHDWGLGKLADATELMVSELVTNAVRHAHARPVELRLVRADTLLCEVDDDDHELPALSGAGPADETGRGLRVVSTLAREWGASRTRAGKTVWFELTLPRR